MSERSDEIMSEWATRRYEQEATEETAARELANALARRDAEVAALQKQMRSYEKALERIRERASNTGCQACWIEVTDALASHPSPEPEGESLAVLGCCVHGVDLDREFCPQGCRV